MSQSLESVKNRLRQSYLGKGGIHGLGLSRAEKAIRVYVDAQAGADESEVIEQLRESARPYPVIVVREDRPRIG
jgi:hypothetical protein